MSGFESFWQDVRYALRTLVKAPGFTLAVALTLGLGIGANTAIFSVINALVFRPLPVEEPGEVVSLFTQVKGVSGFSNFNYPNFVDVRERNQSFTDVFGQSLLRVGMNQGEGRTDLLWGQLVTANYFDVLGVEAQVGRTFNPAEATTEGSYPVVVIGDGLWRRSFGADPGVVGDTIRLNGYPFTIIGVAPEGYQGTQFALALDIWVPVVMRGQVVPGAGDWRNERGGGWLNLLARLKDGVSMEQAQADLNTLSLQLEQAYPEENEDTTIRVFPERQSRGGHPEVGGRMAVTGIAVLGLVSLVLLVACANVINLLLARASSRQTEIGVRIAVGAGRKRLVRQLFTESILLALLGAILGIGFAYVGASLIGRLLPPLPYNLGLDFRPDGRALLYTLGVALVTGVVLGMAPALQALRTELVPVLKGEGAVLGKAYGRFRLRNLLIVTQTAVSLMLLVMTALFAKSLVTAQQADPGFADVPMLLASMDLGLREYTPEEGQRFYEQLRARVEALPGVDSVSYAARVPLGDQTATLRLYREEADRASRQEGILSDFNTVDVGYFDTMGIPLLRGRSFTDRDDAAAQEVVVVNETLAQALWPQGEALGRRLALAGDGQPLREVVGVVADGKYRSLTEAPVGMLYLPLEQDYTATMTLHARTSGNPRGLLPAVRGEITNLDPDLPAYDVKTLDEHMTISLWPARMGAAMAAVAGVLATALALVGLYGVMAYSVNQRRKELGVRLAFGAEKKDLFRLVVRQGMTLAGIGIAIGLVLAVLIGVGISSQLYGVSSFDLPVLLGTTLLFLAVAFLASYIPAHRASKGDPLAALRAS